MKYLFLLLLFFISFSAFAQQPPIVNRASAANTVQDARLSALKNLYIPRYDDTAQANIAGSNLSTNNIGIDSCGAIIYTYDVDGYWYRACFPVKHWVRLASGEGGDFWSIDGNDNIDSLVNFFGTTNSQSIVIKVNNNETGRIGTNYNVSFGSNNDAFGSGSFVGGADNVVSGTQGASFGLLNTVSSSFGFAAGSQHTIGSSATASAAFGQINNVQGNRSLSIGTQNNSYATGAFTSGINNIVRTEASYGAAIGYFGTVGGLNGSAFGHSNISKDFNSMVVGQYNDTTGATSGNSFNSDNQLFIVGNGTQSGIDPAVRSNALVVKQNGTVQTPYYRNYGAEIDSIAAWDNDGYFVKVSTADIIPCFPTFQETLDYGNSTDKNDTINVAGFNFTFLDADSLVLDFNSLFLNTTLTDYSDSTYSVVVRSDNTNRIGYATISGGSGLPLGNSFIYPTRQSYQMSPIFTLGIGSKVLEYLNIGNNRNPPTGETDSIALNNLGLVAINGRPLLVRNVQWDSTNHKWITPIKGATGYGSGMLELGGEALILHATPPGVNFDDVPHEILLASSMGTDGQSGQQVTTGYYTQTKAPIFARYSEAPYTGSTNNTWNFVTGVSDTIPVLWISTSQGKSTDNELGRFESNASDANVFPAMYFAKSRGTLAARTIIGANELTGRIGFKAFDGTNYEITAAIEGIVRTVGNNNMGQSIGFSTSPTITGLLRRRLELTADSVAKFNNTFIDYLPTAMTALPNISSFGFTPDISSTNTAARMQQVTSANGGLLWQGFTANTATATALILRGAQGSNSPTVANTIFQVYKWNASTNLTTLANTEIGWKFRNGGSTDVITIMGNGDMSIGSAVTTPTAKLELAAGSATANTAPLEFNSGTLETVIRGGLHQYNNDHYLSNSGLNNLGIGGTIKDFIADSSNSGTSETDAYSYTIKANTLNVNGGKIIGDYTVNLTDITATAQVKVVFAGTTIGDTGGLTISATGAVVIRVMIIRTGTTTARASVNISSPTASTAIYTAETDLTSQDFTIANLLKLTLTAGGAGGGSGDLVAKCGTIFYYPAANN